MKALIPILIILSSCVTHKGVERWIKKNPDKLTIDSTFVVDTVQFITERVEIDTAFSVFTKDTIIQRIDNVTVKTYVYKDSIYQWIERDADTVTVIQERWVGNTLTLDENKNWFEKNWLLILICAILVFLVLRK